MRNLPGMIALVAGGTAACSFVVDLSGFVGPPLDGGDAMSVDVDGGGETGVPVDAEAPASLLPNPGFEDGQCAQWSAERGTVSRDPIARSGGSSCRVCSTATGGFNVGSDFKGIVPLLGERYRMRGWVRSAPDAPSVMEWAAILQTEPLGDNEYGPSVAPTQDWKSLDVTYTVGVAGGQNLRAYFNTNFGGVAGRCSLFDDVVLEKLP